MFNADISWQSDSAYHINYNHAKAKFNSDARMSIFEKYSAEKTMLFSIMLDPVLDYLLPLYSKTGRPAKNQAQILRSLLLFSLLLNKTPAKLSLTSWIREVLPYDPALIALIGCSNPYDLPPLGSYYDFMNRVWNADRSIYQRHYLLPAGKNKKPDKKIGTDGKLIEPDPDKYDTMSLKNKIISGDPLSDNPEAVLQDIFYALAILPSYACGLIPSDNLTISGDGTAVKVHAGSYGHRLSSCVSPDECPYHQTCPRHYSDPDADWGYDSHERTYYFGRTLYMLCCRNNEYKIELPILLKFMNARRHDSINFFCAIDELGRHEPIINPRNICLDSAHDNIATYQLLDRWNINALIDINPRAAYPEGHPDDITLDKEGKPICMSGDTMCSWGFDKKRNAHKYRCPMKCGRKEYCLRQHECSDSRYGRTVYIKATDDIRFSTRIPRGSDEYKKIYSERTACERVNNRVLNDYHLLNMKIRGTDHYSFWTMLIGICIHLEARYKVFGQKTA